MNHIPSQHVFLIFRSPSDTITNLRYQVLRRLYDNYNIYACFVTLYDRQDWELGISESDTIQLALPADESDVKYFFIFERKFFF